MKINTNRLSVRIVLSGVTLLATGRFKYSGRNENYLDWNIGWVAMPGRYWGR